MLNKIKGSDIQVTKEDQALINQFSKLFSKHQDNQAVLQGLNEKIVQHKDTLDELIMNDDEDVVRYRFGVSFFSLATEQARDLVEKDIKRVEEQRDALNKEMEAVSKKMRKLKSTLYSKFGNAINLEA